MDTCRLAKRLPALIVLLSAMMFGSKAYSIDRVELTSKPSQFPEFVLNTASGNDFTQEDLKGHWSMMAIGFTSCPEVCSFVLSNLRAVSKAFIEQYDTDLEIVFVAIDPKRDRAVLGDYVKNFGTNIVGITGDESQLNKVSDAINATYRLGTADKHGGYMVTHSAFAVVISPEGKVVATLYPPLKAAETVEQLSGIVNSADKLASR